jgi:hypothetical protein
LILNFAALADGVPEGAARCGMIGLAGLSVAAAFVGASAASLAVVEALRELLGGTAEAVPSYEVISVSLANPTRVEAAPNRRDGIVDSPRFRSGRSVGATVAGRRYTIIARRPRRPGRLPPSTKIAPVES